MSSLQFDRIYLDQSRHPGRFRIADSGLGWKVSQSQNSGGSSVHAAPVLVSSTEIVSAQWSKGAKGYEVRVQTKNNKVFQLDGFDLDEFNSLKNAFQRNYNVVLDQREHCVRGWNWGHADFGRSELIFQVNNRPDFEIPYTAVNNSNLAGRNEVSLEFNVKNDHSRAGDELVEMRFYVPGTVSKDGDGSGGEQANNAEEQSAAVAFYEQLKENADIGVIAGDAIVSFSDVLFLTPRGRYDIDMYPTSLRLRGKTYDYKIQYSQIQRLFSLPKPDEVHHVLILQIDPPLRQGQTRYPFLTLQFLKDEEIEVELNLDDDEFTSKYVGKLKKKYDQAAHAVVSQCFKGLTETKVTVPGSYTSRHHQAGVSCSLKASEGHLYPLEKCFLFITKPTVYIPLSEIAYTTFSRVGGASTSSSRTFDLTFTLRGGNGEHQFSNINREEQKALEDFIKVKGIKIKDDINEQQAMLSSALAMESDTDSDDGDFRGSAAEDESVDEDFNDSAGDSEVAEEFDSNADSGSDEEMESDTEKPPKKKLHK